MKIGTCNNSDMTGMTIENINGTPIPNQCSIG